MASQFAHILLEYTIITLHSNFVAVKLSPICETNKMIQVGQWKLTQYFPMAPSGEYAGQIKLQAANSISLPRSHGDNKQYSANSAR